MTPRDVAVFDSAVDYIQRPSELSGTWSTGAVSDLEARVRSANLVVIGTVQTIRSDVDATRRRTLHVLLTIEETLFGQAPGDSIALAVEEAEAGFDTVARHDSQLLQRRFIATVKWARTDAGSVVPRWHLSPASEANITDVTRLVRQRRQSTGVH